MNIPEHKDWPHVTWDQAKLSYLLAEVRFLQGRLLGRMDILGQQLREEATLATLTQDVLKTSEIEGIKLDIDEVHSTIARQLGIDSGLTTATDLDTKGIIEITLDATRNWGVPLTEERLLDWHAALCGFDACCDKHSSTQIAHFLRWLNAPSRTDLIIKAAIAHFWFVTIQPFEDGNGHIARAIADMMLARSEKSRQRFYSMSAQIQREQHTYYAMLETCQNKTLDITSWIEWFLNCLKRAMTSSAELLQTMLTKAKFRETHSSAAFNERQRTIINQLLDGTTTKLNSSEWAKLAKCSQDTALRDINDLLARKILIKEKAGGRSTRYQLQTQDLA